MDSGKAVQNKARYDENHFLRTREQVKSLGHANDIELKLMEHTKATLLEEPRYEELSRKLSSVEKPTTYGIIYNGCASSFDYLADVCFVPIAVRLEHNVV